jgi:hypothetical protein
MVFTIQAVLSMYPGRSDSDQLVSRPFRHCSAGIKAIQAVIIRYSGHSGSDQLVSRPFRQRSDGYRPFRQ